MAARIEDEYGVSVEVVNVGDCDLDETLRPIVHATGEAVTNAAKHAGTGKVDVYAEVTDGAVDVFVRDRGRGLRPGRGARGQVRRAQEHRRPDAATRGFGRGPVGAR